MSAARGTIRKQQVHPGRYLTLSCFAVLVAFICLLPAGVSAQTPPVATANLANYVRVGRYALPEPTRTTPPDGVSLLAQEASSVTYDWDTDTLFVVGDGGTSVVQVSKTGALIDSMTLAPGSSPQGTEFYDTEGITYVGGGKFVMTEERYRQLVEFTYVATTAPTFTQLHRADTKTVKLGTTIGNIGLEGVTYDPLSSGTCDSPAIGFIVVKEKDPRSIFQTCIDFAAGTTTNASPTTVESTDLFDPALINVIDFSDIFALSNLPSLSGAPEYPHLLIISQESGQIVQVDRSGSVLHTMTIVKDAGDVISVPDMTHEGVTMDRAGVLYTVSEDGGGDINHPELWVYAPSHAANLAPTAVTLTGAVTSLPENTGTTNDVKLADILVTDDGIGDNSLSVSGADASSFKIIGTALFLKAGTLLDATGKPSYHINVDVDDTTVGGTPDASTAYTLTITAASAGAINLAITEAAPWSSGNTPPNTLNADWFEVTNFGTSAVSLVGWTMDDNSNSSSVSVPLHGVTSIAPGESVIFIETADLSDSTLAAKATAFINLWFGGTAPEGLQIGSYSGSGVGLSTGGDAVNLFDIGGTLRANISFPAVAAGPPFYTFDNTAGVNNALISNLSSVGLYGAHFATNDGNEVGSPGTIGSGAAPIINITATDANASETGPDPGAFRITRSGSSVLPLTAFYTIAAGAGQATSSDYTPTLTGSATIAAGDSFVDLTITPVDDALVEGTETLTLTLSDSGSYDVGPAASATVTIADNDALNLPPTAVILNNTVSTLGEATSTASAVRVADISVTDDGLGVNSLSLSGADAASFQITGASLYLKAGTVLSHTTKPSYSVTVNVDDVTVGGSPDAHADFVLTITASVAPGTIVISEVAPWSSSNSPIAVDWFEVTNTGKVPVDITGWKMDDNSHAISSAVPLNGITNIGPGEAVIFMEDTPADLAAKAAAFRTLWFGSNPPATLQIGSYSGSGVGLSSSGDEVTLFDAAGNLVTGVGFPAAPASAPFATFDNHSGLGGTTLPLPMVATLSAVGVNGAFAASGDASETGSPGIGNVGRLIISEVTPWGSSTTSYAADWFEVTNVGSAAVDMTGWLMDDNSNGTLASTRVPLVGVGSVAPRQSVVFIETASAATTPTTIAAFETAWFGSNVPSGFTIGSYTGAGVGLSATADAVNLFDSAGNRITGVQFGAATSNFTFDNAAGLGSSTIPLPFISTLSVAGVNGAFLGADGVGTGSPGSKASTTISINNLPVSVLFGGSFTPTYAYTGDGTASSTSSTTSICTVGDSGLVSFVGVGTCKLTAHATAGTVYAAVDGSEQSFGVSQAGQVITFTSIAPTAAKVGGAMYDVTASGGASGNAVTFSIDATAAAVCSISGSTVSFTGVGTCVIDANQAGNTNYSAAAQAQQSFSVGQGAQVITFTSIAPTTAKVGGATYNVTASGGASGNAVTFSIDATTAAVCSISGSTVSFTGVGTCVIDANQAGNTNYSAAAQAQQSFSVGQAATLQSITIAPLNPSIAKGLKQQFTATGHYNDSSTHDLSSSVSWTSSKTSVATINSSGLASGINTGTSTIKAQLGAISGSTTLTVMAAQLQSIAVTPVNPSIPNGGKQDFVALGTYSDGTIKTITSRVTWSSSNTQVATINTTGRATASAAGNSTIQAASGSVSTSTTLTVTGPVLQSLAIKPNNPSVAKGLTKQFTVKGNYTDGSSQDLTASVTWTSLNVSVATIGNTGLATGVGTGTSTIQATLGNISDSTTLTVTSPVLQSISVTPVNPSIAKSATQQFTATGTYSDGSTNNITSTVTWSSAKPTVASVNSTGLATGIKAGTAVIKAALVGNSGTSTLTVTP